MDRARNAVALILGLTASTVAATASLGGPSGCTSLSSIAPFTQFNYEMQLQGLWGLLLDPKDPDSGLCTSCHPGQSGAAGLGLGDGLSYANLVGIASLQDPNFIRVVPGDPTNSLLLQKVNCDVPGVGNRMPPTQTLSPTQQRFIYDWISYGAPLSRLGFEDR